jgi:hypothetical protein
METITLPAGRPNSARAAAFIQSLPVDQAWRVVVEPWKPRRSEQQNRYLWGLVYPAFLKHLDGWDAEDLHEYFLGECYGWDTIEGFGKKRMKPIRRSSRMSKQEFSDYVAFVQRKGAEMGVYIEDPQL